MWKNGRRRKMIEKDGEEWKKIKRLEKDGEEWKRMKKVREGWGRMEEDEKG